MTWSAGVHNAPPSWLVRTVPFGIGPAKSSSRIAHTPLNSGWMPSTGASIMPRHGLSLRGRHRRAAGHRARHGVAADRGIVMRTGEAFQTSRLVRRIVWDKAGNLTEGKPTVRAVCPVAGHEDEVLALAAAAISVAASVLAGGSPISSGALRSGSWCARKVRPRPCGNCRPTAPVWPW